MNSKEKLSFYFRRSSVALDVVENYHLNLSNAIDKLFRDKPFFCYQEQVVDRMYPKPLNKFQRFSKGNSVRRFDLHRKRHRELDQFFPIVDNLFL